MDCRTAEDLIQSELDAAIASDSALAEHCASCPDCASLREALRSIDAALAATAVDKAPAWLATAVMNEIARPVDARRLEPAVVTVGSVLGSVAVVTTLIRTGALAGVTGPVGRFISVANAWFDSLASAATTSPGVEAVRTFQPGDVAVGVIWALAAVGAAFLAVSALRLSKEFSLDRRRVLSR